MSTVATLSFIHRFEPATQAGLPPVLLLHGTGGNEDDLLPLGRSIAPGAALLSPRGQVLEAGMPRFFKRLAEGVFDEADLARRTDDLAGFVRTARSAYGLDAPVAVGFSNGANIAAALLLRHPGVLRGAALLRAMAPFRSPPVAGLAGVPVLLLSGNADPIVPAENAALLAATLAEAGAVLQHHVLAAGHGLSQDDIALLQRWMEALPA